MRAGKPQLRAIFAEASRVAPSVLFIDEVDVLCPKRDDAASELDRRIVTAMLTLLDGAGSVSHRGLSKSLATTARVQEPHRLTLFWAGRAFAQA